MEVSKSQTFNILGLTLSQYNLISSALGHISEDEELDEDVRESAVDLNYLLPYPMAVQSK